MFGCANPNGKSTFAARLGPKWGFTWPNSVTKAYPHSHVWWITVTNPLGPQMGLLAGTPTHVHCTWPGLSLPWQLISKSESCVIFYDLALGITDHSHRPITLRGRNMDSTSQQEECPCHFVRRSHGMRDVVAIILENTFLLYLSFFAIIFTTSAKVDPISYYYFITIMNSWK